MAKKTDPKPPAKPIKKKLAAKSAAVAKPAKAAAAEPVIAKVKTATKPTTAAKPAAKPVVAKPSAPKAAKKPAKAKIERSRPLLPDEPETAPAASDPTGELFYFPAHSIDPQVTTTPPAGATNGEVSCFADFAEVRQHAIDYLVDLIDRCEVRLWQIKRADAFETLEQLLREHDHPPVPAAGEETPPAPS